MGEDLLGLVAVGAGSGIVVGPALQGFAAALVLVDGDVLGSEGQGSGRSTKHGCVSVCARLRLILPTRMGCDGESGRPGYECTRQAICLCCNAMWLAKLVFLPNKSMLHSGPQTSLPLWALGERDALRGTWGLMVCRAASSPRTRE